QKRCHSGDLERARPDRRRPRARAARFDSDHNERQGSARRLHRAIPPRPIRPVGRLARPRAGNKNHLMLATVLIMALAVSVEPFRIGMTVLMLNRPRPALQLFAFLCGGFCMGTTVGLVVLFVFRRLVLGTNFVTVPRVQVLIGLLVLVIAGAIAVDLFGRLGPRPAKLARPA